MHLISSFSWLIRMTYQGWWHLIKAACCTTGICRCTEWWWMKTCLKDQRLIIRLSHKNRTPTIMSSVFALVCSIKRFCHFNLKRTHCWSARMTQLFIPKKIIIFTTVWACICSNNLPRRLWKLENAKKNWRRDQLLTGVIRLLAKCAEWSH